MKVEAVRDPGRDDGLRIAPERLRRGVFRRKQIVIRAPTTDVDAALPLLYVLAGVACILERFPRLLQEHALLWIHVDGFLHRNSEEGRIELIDGVNEATLAAICAEGRFGRYTIARVPARDFVDQVLAAC